MSPQCIARLRLLSYSCLSKLKIYIFRKFKNENPDFVRYIVEGDINYYGSLIAFCEPPLAACKAVSEEQAEMDLLHKPFQIQVNSTKTSECTKDHSSLSYPSIIPVYRTRLSYTSIIHVYHIHPQPYSGVITARSITPRPSTLWRQSAHKSRLCKRLSKPPL